VQPLGWYHDPLTVVMAGEDVPVRGERLFVGLQKARLYNGDQRQRTILHNADFIGQCERFRLIVGDVENSEFRQLTVKTGDFFHH
ncbi:hypothetical protein MJN51_34025, partial [Salmonella enterica subsp. enterica serovar Kentucky]|nr:hypothetical protein [Salmonella enterica subsp. enterica serovar Kentucky]